MKTGAGFGIMKLDEVMLNNIIFVSFIHKVDIGQRYSR